MAAAPEVIEMYADLSCPFAYVVHARWRKVREEFAGRIALHHKSLSLEYVNHVPTPKRDTETEAILLLANEPAISYRPWSAPASQWPVTMLPAFEAVKCAENQGPELADDYAWAIRAAFFAESRCISMRHVLIEIASETDLDLQNFVEEFDSGRQRQHVIADARRGWDELGLPGSPTWVIPNGSRISDFGLLHVSIDEAGRALVEDPARCNGSACLDEMRTWLHSTLSNG
jgi:predicted DsbA family dithiol-disulfide isomerase